MRLARAELRSSREQIDRHRAELVEQLPVLDEKARSALPRWPRFRGAERPEAARDSGGQRGVAGRADWRHVNEEQKLELIEQRLATQIESFDARQQVFAARFNAAEAQLRINEALSGLTGELADLGLALEHAEDSALWMQARASAVEEIIAGRLAGGQLEDNSRADRLDSEVEVRLAQLSRELRRPVP